LAAVTNVDEAEKEKLKGIDSNTWKVNVIGTANIIELCRRLNSKLIYFSTDFVFDGYNGPYTESDIPSPINFYGLTKYEGEKLVKQLDRQAMIVRISYPFRSKISSKK